MRNSLLPHDDHGLFKVGRGFPFIKQPRKSVPLTRALFLAKPGPLRPTPKTHGDASKLKAPSHIREGRQRYACHLSAQHRPSRCVLEFFHYRGHANSPRRILDGQAYAQPRTPCKLWPTGRRLEYCPRDLNAVFHLSRRNNAAKIPNGISLP